MYQKILDMTWERLTEILQCPHTKLMLLTYRVS